MGLRGPKPKTAEQKRKEGNPGRRKVRPDKNDGQSVLKSIDPPIYMRRNSIAAAEWRKYSKDLISRRILTISNIKALEAYCFAYSIYRKALKELDDAGIVFTTSTGYKSQHPAIAIIKGAQADMRAWRKVIDETTPDRPKKASKFGQFRKIAGGKG